MALCGVPHRRSKYNALLVSSISDRVPRSLLRLARSQMYAQCNAKWLYVICLTLFETGSAICGAAPNIECLIVGRVIAGFAGTGTYTGVS